MTLKVLSDDHRSMFGFRWENNRKCVNREVRVGDIIGKSHVDGQSKSSERTAEKLLRIKQHKRKMAERSQLK